MLKLELPFHPTESADGVFLRSGPGDRPLGTSEIILEGFSISIETAGKTYEVCSDGYSSSDSPGSFRGTMWPRSLLPLPCGTLVEQQMLLPAPGGALAVSWRLVGRAFFPARLMVSPLFLVAPPSLGAGFGFEPETDGGRLAWRPHDHSSKIIADTNGCFAPGARCRGFKPGADFPAPRSVVPGTFLFALGPHPAVLILASEAQTGAAMDPLIGAFLAQVARSNARPRLIAFHRETWPLPNETK